MDEPNDLVVLCGVDAVGKSSVAAELAKLLGAATVKTPTAAFDGLRYLAEGLTPYGRYCFYASSVTMSMADLPTRLKTSHVVCDRGIQCTVAFHAAMGVEIPERVWEKLGSLEPTLSILLTASPDVAAERIRRRLGDKRPDAGIEQNADLQLRVAQEYRRRWMGDEVPAGFRLREISTDGKTPEAVAREILAML